jgi:aryl-alcohol dehydrogenase-like predicted oxidoreductase
MKQLEENISSIEVDLSDELLNEIESIHNNIPDPSP